MRIEKRKLTRKLRKKQQRIQRHFKKQRNNMLTNGDVRHIIEVVEKSNITDLRNTGQKIEFEDKNANRKKAAKANALYKRLIIEKERQHHLGRHQESVNDEIFQNEIFTNGS